MRILGLSGSARRLSTNTALLRALARLVPEGVGLSVFDGTGSLPVFSPDLETDPPYVVQDYIAQMSEADGVLIASPEYALSIPGGLKNTLDWIVSRDTLAEKPIALAHASHRGDDMLADLRRVLATLSTRFAPDLFLRFLLMKMTPDEVADIVAQPQNAKAASNFLSQFAVFSRRP